MRARGARARRREGAATLVWASAALLAAACGCGAQGTRDAGSNTSDGAATADLRLGRDAGAAIGPDARALPRCDGAAGSPCTTTDPCAITARCGDDGRCHVAFGQICNDGLSCTRDLCLGHGLCSFQVEGETCLVLVREGSLRRPRCMLENEANPDNVCERCRPRNDKTAWTKLTGSLCDDGDSCTTNDHCETGRCVGEVGGGTCR
ncbi:MAG: hypothetical protein IPL40_07725 [Proteobacteria bacterium]|nr:hypothetical protein [Pseudomonadota bacterium]